MHDPQIAAPVQPARGAAHVALVEPAPDAIGQTGLRLDPAMLAHRCAAAAEVEQLDRPALLRTIRLWRAAAPVGILSVVGSAGWFTAMTLQNAAYVRAVGQVELIFTLFVSRYGFGERPTLRELGGIALVAGGVIVLLIGR